MRWALLTDVLTPGGLAAATRASILAPATFERWLTTGVPRAYAAQYTDPTAGGRVVVLWSDDFDVELLATVDNGAALELTDQFGAPIEPSGGVLHLGGAVQYLTLPAGSELLLAPPQPFGPNVAAADLGARAVASSAVECDGGIVLDPGRALDAIDDATNVGNNCDGEGMSVWLPTDDDPSPQVTITLSQPTRIDRVFVAGKGLGSIETGIRSLSVEVADTDGAFREVARVDNAFFDRSQLLSFPAVETSSVRITIAGVNYSGYGNGLRPSFWSDVHRRLGGIYTIEVYADATAPAGGSGDRVAPAPSTASEVGQAE